MRIPFAVPAVCILAAPIVPGAAGAQVEVTPRVIVTDFVNTSRDRHAITASAASQAVADALARQHVYDVVPRKDLDRVAQSHALRPPYAPADLGAVAKDLGATLLVTGEVQDVGERKLPHEREVEVGLIVRVRGVDADDLVNGAAMRAAVTVPSDTTKTDGELLVDAASLAATRAVTRMAGYRPIEGTIMSPPGFGSVVLNRGTGDGVKQRQEFLVMRDGYVVGRVRASRVSDNYTEMIVLDDTRGIRPQDRVISVFPDPKLPR